MSTQNNGGAASSAPIEAAAPAAIESTVNESTENLEATESNSSEEEEEVAPTPAEKKRIKKLKLKVDGEEFEEELPFEIDEDQEEYVRKHLQLSKMSQKRAQSAKDIEKKARTLVEMIQKDPMAVLSDPALGLDVKKVIAEYIEKEIQESEKTPEQKQREQMEQELRALREEREKEREASKAREKEALEERELQRYDQLMSDALTGNADLPKTPYVVKKMAEHMLAMVKKGINATPQDVVSVVREEMQNDLKQMFAVLPEDVIEKLVGKETINKLRKKSVAKGKAINAAPPSDATSKSKEKKEQNEKKETFKEFFKF